MNLDRRQITEFERTQLETLTTSCVNFGTIDPELYQKYSVKRGLRNADGTGVVVGLTNIGDVHGYILDEGEKVPVEGRLRYRGIEIEEIVRGFQTEKRHGFREVVYLLLFGRLPTVAQLDQFTEMLGACCELPEGFTENMILKAPSHDIMNKLARAVLASYSYDSNPDSLDIRNVLRQCIELIARFPTMVAYALQAKNHYYDNRSLFLHKPQPGLGTAQNFLHMIRPDSSYTQLEADILDLSLVLHAEHGGGNNSAFALHVVSSSDTDTYSAVAAAIGSLKGPKHGGANVKVVEMLDDIKKNVRDWKDDDEIRAYIAKIICKDAFDGKGLVYGIGHAVYTLSDPRAIILREKAEQLAGEKGFRDEFGLYKRIEQITPGIFAQIKQSTKPLAANVDFYSGFVYSMLNLPRELYTPIFAISRIAGWSAHRIEEIVSGGRIIRPAYKSVVKKAHYVPLQTRAS